MSYWHMFFGIDLDQLRSIFASGDDALVDEMLQKRAEDLQDLNDTFCDEIDEGRFPDAETALREIIDGSFDFDDGAAMYGYALKAICEHIGRPIGKEVSCIDELPFRSKLAESGPPVAIPEPPDFPEIGFLELSEIPAEIERIDEVAEPSSGGGVKSWFARLTRKDAATSAANDTAEEMKRYRETLTEAVKMKVSVVSFRH